MEFASRIELADEADFALGDLLVRPSSREVLTDGRREIIEPRVMQVLVALAEKRGAVVSRESLIQRCWNGVFVGDDAVNRAIGKLRRLAETTDGRFSIETIERVGYRLIAAPHAETENSRVGDAAPGFLGRIQANRRRAVTVAAIGLAVMIGVGFLETGLRKGAHSAHAASIRATTSGRYVGPTRFVDCARFCPQMIVLPPGGFSAGGSSTSREDSDDGFRRVAIPYALAVSRYDVTRREFARFADETHRRTFGDCFTFTIDGQVLEGHGTWAQPGFAQSPIDPVVCVSWDDAEDYARWLSATTGKPYRLLSESEWEYAARAGATGRTYWDDRSSPCAHMNAADLDYHAVFPNDPRVNPTCHDGYARTSPVGRFPPNRFGLYDMLGNVWQWTGNCFELNLESGAGDGVARPTDACSRRTVRGGAWIEDPEAITLARRLGGSPGDHYPSNGFRVARVMGG
jgi:formylglycine-generating enzyme